MITCKDCGQIGLELTEEMLDRWLLKYGDGEGYSIRFRKHKANGGFSRAGTQRLQCDDCDPYSWKNLTSNQKKFLADFHAKNITA